MTVLSCAGAKTRADMYQAFELIYPTLQSFRKGANTAAPALPPPSVPTHQVMPWLHRVLCLSKLGLQDHGHLDACLCAA